MAQEVQEVRIFVASPSDVSEMRQIAFEEIDEVNHLLDSQGVRAKRVAWEDLSPGVGADGQDVINQQVGDNYDIFVGLLWQRFGTPTSRAESGTEEEFNRALDIHRRWPNAIKILTYRCIGGPVNLRSVDTTQLASLNTFVKRLAAAGVLYHEFTAFDEYRKHLRRDLFKALKDFGSSWGGERAVISQRLSGRLLELHNAIGGPFRSAVLDSLREKLESAGIECYERLRARSQQELIAAGIDELAIATIKEDLARCGGSLRNDDTPQNALDQLALTSGCRDAIRQIGITNPEELTSRSWNDLMLTGHFVPEWIEEISLRLQRELGLNLRENDEAPLA